MKSETLLHFGPFASLRVTICGFVLCLLAACGNRSGESEHTTLRFWAFGREGEVLQELMPEFERQNPGIRVRVQQIPWTAAHEKLLTAYVGNATPDLAQVGNTWIPEFAALGALEPLDQWDARSSVMDSAAWSIVVASRSFASAGREGRRASTVWNRSSTP